MTLNIIDAMEGEFRPWFFDERDPHSWNSWKVVLKAAHALPMSEAELATFRELAGGRDPPRQRVHEIVIIAGRRCGKDSVSSLLAPYMAAIEQSHVGRLRPGEQCYIYCIAADRDQAKAAHDLIRAYFAHVPGLKKMVKRETRDGFELKNGVTIAIATNSFRAVRGRTASLVILDEVAFFRDEASASPDVELYRALTPSLTTIPNSMMVLISTPYKRSGLLYDRWKDCYGKNDDRTLVIQASSVQLNPLIDLAEVEADREKDPLAAKSEWDGIWRDDVAADVPLDVLEDAVDEGVTHRPPRRGVRYHGSASKCSSSTRCTTSSPVRIATNGSF